MAQAAGVKSVKLPSRSPNLNPHAERFVRSNRTRVARVGEGQKLGLLSNEAT